MLVRGILRISCCLERLAIVEYTELDDRTRHLRVFHGPVNIAGQATSLSDYQKSVGILSETAKYFDDNYGPPGDINLSLRNSTTLGKAVAILRLFFVAVFRYNFFHFYFGKSIIPLNLDLPILRLLGKKVLMTYCGSDVRLMRIEKKRNPYWDKMIYKEDNPKFDFWKILRMKWHKLWIRKVIAIRNQYEHVASVFPKERIVGDIWLHNAMDMSAYCPTEFKVNAKPVLVHAPSMPVFKGTRFVEAIINELREEGHSFEFVLLHNISYQKVHQILRERADIVLDQFLPGGFGSLAVESMYCGKPVMDYLVDSVKKAHYPDCPIVNANIDNLKQKLIWLMSHPAERIRIGRAGRAYVEKHFDRSDINRRVLELYATL